MPKFFTTYLPESEYHQWNAFVESQPAGNIFHHTGWLMSIYSEQDKKITLRVIVCKDKEDRIVGGMAFGSKRKYGVQVIEPPLLSQFSGLLLSHRETKYPSKDLGFRNEMLESIIELLEKDHRIIDLILPPELYDIRVFNWKGYQNKVRYTFRGALNEGNQLEEVFEPSIKRQIKKAKRQNYMIQSGYNDQLINDFYKLQTLSLNRQNHDFKFTYQQFHNLIGKLEESPLGLSFYVAYSSDQPIAAQASISYKETAYYWLAGGDPEYFNSGINPLLMYYVFDDLHKKGLHYFDFVGANTPGVADYKANFNFDLTPYYKVDKTIGRFASLMLFLKKTFL